MVTAHTTVWSALDHRSADAFLVAGVLLLASPAHIGLELFLDVPLPSWLVASVILPGLLAALVGLGGLYPRLAARAPRTAAVGGAFTTLACVTLVVLLGWLLGDGVLTATAEATIGSPPGFVFLSLPVTMTLAFVAFGTASLRVAVPSRRIGALLSAFALPWVVTLVATTVYGSAFPRWLTLAIYGPIPFVMLATGYTLRMESLSTVRDPSAADTTAG